MQAKCKKLRGRLHGGANCNTPVAFSLECITSSDNELYMLAALYFSGARLADNKSYPASDTVTGGANTAAPINRREGRCASRP